MVPSAKQDLKINSVPNIKIILHRDGFPSLDEGYVMKSNDKSDLCRFRVTLLEQVHVGTELDQLNQNLHVLNVSKNPCSSNGIFHSFTEEVTYCSIVEKLKLSN